MLGDVVDPLAVDEHLPPVVERFEIVRSASHRKASLPQDYARGGQRREWAGRLQKAIAWIELGNPAGLASEQPGRGKTIQIKPHVRLLAGAVAAAVLCFTTPADAQITMKFATLTINDMQHEYIKIYKDELEKATDGRIKVEIYPAGQLGGAPRQTEGLRLGTIEAAIGPSELFFGADPRFQVLGAGRPVQGQRACAQGARRAGVPQAIADFTATRGMITIGLTSTTSSCSPSRRR